MPHFNPHFLPAWVVSEVVMACFSPHVLLCEVVHACGLLVEAVDACETLAEWVGNS